MATTPSILFSQYSPEQEQAIIISSLARVISGDTFPPTVPHFFDLRACRTCGIDGCLGCDLFPDTTTTATATAPVPTKLISTATSTSTTSSISISDQQEYHCQYEQKKEEEMVQSFWDGLQDLIHLD
ncbi:hypothetical protein J5N97_009229 [Dioscorea zingiberensis]|uniref:Uncharacterized protein n=1 Tax=Dioscorea zingiberensis TaxID=325984 RepID=A0A9D5HLH0_9LILI|nr:hypothetical protein J5N97_009229 [Dioscorea zingiberensis]